MMQNSTRFSEFWTNTRNRIVGWLAPTTDPELRALKLREFNSNQALMHFEGLAPKLLKVDPKTLIDDNIFVNYPEMIVDKGVSFLFGDGLKIEVEDDKAQAWLDSVWSEEQRTEDLHDLATDGGIFGDAWIKIVINDAGRPEPVILDPSIWTKVVDEHNYKKILAYRCQYKKADGKFFREETRQNGQKWETQAFESVDGKKWYETGEPTIFPFAFCPVGVAKNLPKSKSIYGRPDLTRSVLDLCKYISRTDSLIGKIIRVHASPKSVAKGLAAQDLQIGVDSTIFLKNPEATLSLLEMTGDLAGSLAFRNLLRESLSEVSKVPEIASGNLDKIGQLSGRAMQILYGPLIKQTQTKRKLYGPLISNTVRGLLVAGKFSPETPVVLHWGAPIPPDPREEAELGLIWKECGVSTETILQKLGFEAVDEMKRRAAENDAIAAVQAKRFNSGLAGAGLYE